MVQRGQPLVFNGEVLKPRKLDLKLTLRAFCLYARMNCSSCRVEHGCSHLVVSVSYSRVVFFLRVETYFSTKIILSGMMAKARAHIFQVTAVQPNVLSVTKSPSYTAKIRSFMTSKSPTGVRGIFLTAFVFLLASCGILTKTGNARGEGCAKGS